MPKGTVILVTCIGSVGSIVRDFNSKEVITGSYRHTQTVNGQPLSWKCAQASITGVVKLVQDEYLAPDAPAGATPITFYRMEGLVDRVETVTQVQSVAEALKTMVW